MNPEYLASVEIPSKRPIIVNDIMKCQLRPGVSLRDIDRATQVLFASSFEIQPVYFTTEQLLKPTVVLFKSIISTLNTETTAVIFPGNGARSLYEDIWKDNITFDSQLQNVFTDTEIWVKRKFENGKPTGVTVDLSKGIRDAFDWPKYKTVLVIDDVIATGMTMNAIKNKLEYAPYKKYDFIAISWFLRSPTGIEGYSSVNSVIRYSAMEGYPALNSLSTLLRCDVVGEAVRESYKKKSWIKYPRGFDKEIKTIRELTTI